VYVPGAEKLDFRDVEAFGLVSRSTNHQPLRKEGKVLCHLPFPFKLIRITFSGFFDRPVVIELV
jgi:hypothetical protein